MKQSNHSKMMDEIKKHGIDLLRIFPYCQEGDPVNLCKRLRKIESECEKHTTALCNGFENERQAELSELALDRLQEKAELLLDIHEDQPNIFINRDPRGYALKIREEEAKDLAIQKDWGGYGIIAPDFTPN